MVLLPGLLHEPLDSGTKRQISLLFWPLSSVQPNDMDLSPYFTYYAKQCHHALHDQGKHILARTHQHILDVSRDLEQYCDRDIAKSHVKRLFTSPNHPHEDEILNNTVDLAARIYTMVNIGGGKYAISGHCQLEWEDGNLKDFLSNHFDQKPELDKGSIKLERGFKACKLQKIAGINIQWTDNLADHLRLVDDEDKTVAIFHHASFLKRQNSQLFPLGLVEETLRTIALLFPHNDSETNEWFRKSPNSHGIDKMLLKCGSLRLDDRQFEKFHFWHDRLVILKQAFDESRPAGLVQWWFDRRNGVQWYTFWVAVVVLVLTIFFGLVQSIEGALQVYKAYHPS